MGLLTDSCPFVSVSFSELLLPLESCSENTLLYHLAPLMDVLWGIFYTFCNIFVIPEICLYYFFDIVPLRHLMQFCLLPAVWTHDLDLFALGLLHLSVSNNLNI